MSRHWKPEGGGGWLSPEAYRALSPQERRALWRERNLARHNRRFQPPARDRRGYFAGQRMVSLLVAVPLCVFAASAVQFLAPKFAGSASPLSFASAASAPVSVSFTSCKWGGGTNCVVDGDTFWIGGQKVRIAGIDAPETHDYRCQSELALGDQATDKLQALLNSGVVTMTSIDRDRDRYGRLLRNVQVNGADVGEAMVSAGVAREYAGGRRGWCG